MEEKKRRSCLFLFIGMTLGFLTCIALIVTTIVFIAMSFSRGITVKNNSWLILDFAGDIVEKPLPEVSALFGGNPRKMELLKYLKAIENASFDDRIEGIIINADLTSYARAHIEEIGESLVKFKSSGKKVYAWFSDAEINQYYLCSFADKIYMPNTNSAGLTIIGYSQVLPYYKDVLDKVGIEFNVIHIGNYKGTGENFVKNTMSDELRRSYLNLMDSIYNNFIKNICEKRNIEEKKFISLIESGKTLSMTPDDAKKNGFIDDKKSYLELTDSLKRNNSFNHVSIINYSNLQMKNIKLNKIAIVYADGTIANYYSGENGINGSIIGSITFNEDLEKIKKDNNVKAVIIRTNSPGGSALASELIFQTIKDLKKVKPVYISFGPVAASGGYYISCGADRIFVSPSTITGSIGVVSMFMNYEKLAEKIGINFETIKKYKYDDFLSPDKKPTDEEISILKKSMENIYKEFTNHVIEERKIERNDIFKIAEGRVWTGVQAVDIKLADQLGGLLDAIDYAVKQNKIGDYSIDSYPKPVSFFDKLASLNRIQMNTELLKDKKINQALNLYYYLNENGLKPSLLLPFYNLP